MQTWGSRRKVAFSATKGNIAATPLHLAQGLHSTPLHSIRKNKRVYSLICFSQHINDEERSDRVIATKWDAAFVLYDGVPAKKDIDRLKENVPKQEIGRMSNKELALSRANKSVRILGAVEDQVLHILLNS